VLSVLEERRVLKLVEQALELAENRRLPFLDEELANESALLTRAHKLLSLLATEATSPEGDYSPEVFLQEGTLGGAPAPTQIGAYRILQPLGAGGMGKVYLAERSDGAFDKQVAIKVMQSELHGSLFTQRFEAERQMLANIIHPNIAALLDGGHLDNGTPYLVMDYIDGVAIDKYVFENNLSIDQTLDLFLLVCDAVQAAHQSLVVHRDIKPSNILVDEQGKPKLIDFGIAKDLAGVVGEVTQLNRPAVLTLDYASPEQYKQEAITTATDVYALGVMLFVLVSGCKPYSLTDASPLEIQRAIVDDTAPFMRQRRINATSGETKPMIRRGPIPEELELIVAKAIAKEPQRRYATAQNLAEDLRAYKSGQPVVAHGDSWRYLAGKFVRRHWLGLGASTAVVLAMLGALGVSIAQTQSADAAAARSNATANFLERLLLAPSSRADSPLRLGSEAKVSELLDHAAAELKGEIGEPFRGAPNVRAELMLTVARTYHGIAMYPRATELLEQAQSICQTVDCSRNALRQRIDFRLGQSLGLTGQPKRALELFEQAAEGDTDFLLQARIADETASALWSIGDREGTTAKMVEAVELYEAAAGDEPDVLVAVAYTRLGSLFSNLGELERGLSLLVEGAELYESLGQNALPELADLYNEIFIIHLKRGNREVGYEYLALAHEVIERIDGVSEIAIRVLTNLGYAEVKRNNSVKAREWLAQSEATLSQFAASNKEHEALAWVLHLEAAILASEKDYSQALNLYQQERAIYEKLMPAYNHSHATTDVEIGKVLENLGEFKAALDVHQKVLDYYSEIYEDEESTYLLGARNRVASLRSILEQTPP